MARNSKVTPKRKYQGRHIWTIDSETDPFRQGRIPEPFVWGVYTGEDEIDPNLVEGCNAENSCENYFEFNNVEDMLDFVQEFDVICYAHNGGKFDWHFLTQYIPDYEKLTVIAGRLAKFNIGLAEFRDSFNIIPAPLSAYKKDEIDYAIFEPGERDKPENRAKISKYLKTDCVYLHEMIMQFIDDYGMAITQASASMKVWSRMTGIKKPETTAVYYGDMSPYYYGGRVECFKTGIINEPFSVVDINSAYPFAMTHLHPWGTHYSITKELPETDDEITRCFIKLTANSHGAFPLRGDNGLYFPNDGHERTFYITGWEYLAARETNCLNNARILEVREYFETVSFTEYVDYFFEMKDHASQRLKEISENHKDFGYWSAQRLFAKLFLNSLYGKFASNPENYEEFMTIPAWFIDAANEHEGWNMCKLLTEETAVVNRPLPEENHRYYDVAVSASITGFVRAYLWRNIHSCGKTMLYCDTDSIAAGDVSKIPQSDKLGDWELEAECDFAAIGGKKLYAFRKLDGKYKTASKGVRLTPEQIILVAGGQEITHQPEVPTFSIKRKVVFTPRKIRMIQNEASK